MPVMSKPVEVRLRSIDGFDEFKERKILLTPTSKIRIGRSSRSSYKDLKPAVDNAYIDSPVISRDHAVISLNTTGDVPAVYIQDRGSMHGTQLNGNTLKNNIEMELKNGDILQFGMNVIRDQGVFNAKRFEFNADLPAGPITPATPPHTSGAFTVPEPETSEDEVNNSGDDHDPEVPARGVARYGSQSNPVNVDDFDEEVTFLGSSAEVKVDIKMPVVSKTTKAEDDSSITPRKIRSPEWPQNLGLGNSYGGNDHFYIDIHEDEDADSRSECPSHASNYSDIDSSKDDADHDSEDGDKEESVSPEPAPEAKRLPLAERELSDHGFNTDYKSDDSADEHSDDFSNVSDDGYSVTSSPADTDVIRRSKMVEMLNRDAQKEHDKRPMPDPKEGPNMMYADPDKIYTEGHLRQGPPPQRSAGMPMSLSSIMVNDHDIVSSSPDSVPATPAKHPVVDRVRVAQDLSPTIAKAPEQKQPEYAFDPFLGGWSQSPVPPRPAAPQPMRWGSAFPEYDSTLRVNDPWMNSRYCMMPTQPESEFHPQPDLYGYERPGGLSFANPPALISANLSTACSAGPLRPGQPIRDTADHTDGKLTLPTPPPAYTAGESSTATAPEQQEPFRPRTRVSIPEIVEEPPRQPSIFSAPVSNLKRKLDDMEDEEESDTHVPPVPASEAPIAIKREEPTTPKAVVVASGPPKKRLRLQFAATAVAGAVVGGLSVLGALISVPDSWLQ